MDETDRVKNQLCQRIEELEKEKLELNEQLDIAQREAAEARRQQNILKETFTAEIQKAVMRARRSWASQTSDEIKALWMAEGAQKAADSIRYDYEGHVHQDRIADHLDDVALELRRKAEGGEA